MIFAIDPGTSCLGYCIMRSHPDHNYKHPSTIIINAGIIQIKNKIWNEKIPVILQDVFKIYRQYSHSLSDIVIELPEHWSGKVGFAARESGSVMKLMFLVGSLYGIIQHNNLSRVTLVRPSSWKGQMPKEVCHRRLQKIFGKEFDKYENHNTKDAIGIAYWFYKKEIKK